MSESKNNEKLDVTSDKFDPLLALYSPCRLPCPNAPTQDNISKFETTSEGIVIKELKKKVEEPKPTTSKEIILDETKDEKRILPARLRKTVFTVMETIEGPLATLRIMMSKASKIKVVTRNMSGVRGYCSGVLVAFDKLWNLAMEDVTEVWTRKIKKKIPALGRPGRAGSVSSVEVEPVSSTMERCSRKVPKMLLRGEHVVLISSQQLLSP